MTHATPANAAGQAHRQLVQRMRVTCSLSNPVQTASLLHLSIAHQGSLAS